MIEFITETPPNDTKIYKSVSGTLDSVVMVGTSEPTNQFSMIFDFIKQSEFIVETAYFAEWLNAGTDITEVSFPFPESEYFWELMPAVAEGLPPITEDTDFTPPYECWFYYSQTEFVEGTVQFGLRSGVPMFICKSESPVNLLKICFNAKWLKTINLVIYS